MGNFLEAEKPKQAAFKAHSPHFSDSAREPGVYRGHSYPHCLPRDCAHENLFSEIRAAILPYFARNEIKWHDGQGGKPSNHLCDSQVCCANFLFPFASKPIALAELLHPVYPTIREMLPIEDGHHVAFEWIGQRNYLREKVPLNQKRRRGALYTSADAAVMFRDKSGQKRVVLIEWKYTEAYSSTWLKFAASGTDRTTIYAHLYERDDCPFAKELLDGFDALFFEPFYQLVRQQFLAHEMERAHELDADTVSLLHIAPAHNHELRRVTSPTLRHLGESATEVWQRLVREPGRFTSVSTEHLFGRFEVHRYPELAAWWEYITSRFSWLVQERIKPLPSF
jgi:hypothetical protein